MGAISFEEREAPAYDEAAVKAAQEKNGLGKDMHQCENRIIAEMEQHTAGHGCPGSRFMELQLNDSHICDPCI